MSDTAFPFGSTSTHFLDLLRDKDQPAWASLVALYEPLLARRLARFSFTPEERGEVAQNFWLAVFQGLEGFRRNAPGQSLRRWLGVVAQNKAIDFFRSRRRQPHAAVGGSEHLQQLGALPADSFAPENEQVEDQEEKKLILGAALERIRAEISDASWRQFELTAIRGNAVALVAQECGVTPAAIRMNNSRVKKLLRERMGALWE